MFFMHRYHVNVYTFNNTHAYVFEMYENKPIIDITEINIYR